MGPEQPCQIDIFSVEVPTGALGSAAHPTGAFGSMRAALQAAGYQVPNMKYLVFADAPALCGIAETFLESQKG